ncbi:MAG TPA: SUMF1/EgtB/PvdO family nonheme iron enzyme [Thermotogota bacterium]|nr:SUMF1/EgtB/PvdO family nonheme iron enzyme [Thermotogota bacterium]HQQ66823.1 SUMF1/EgtB/PvdO family nonheme iron enzyme [Thermotogota bacterium]
MKRRGLILLLLIGLLALNAFGKNYAIVVGINTYKNMDKLTNAERDAREIESLLADLGYETIALTGSSVTNESILEEIAYVAGKSRTSDTLVFFFSGHGFGGNTKDERGIATYYSKEAAGNYITQTRLEVELGQFRGKKYVILDACNQGSAVKASARMRVNLSEKVDLFITSSASNQKAKDEFMLEGRQINHGVAAYFLMEALGGKADKNRDNRLTTYEIGYYFRDMATKYRNYLPQDPEVDYVDGNDLFADLSLASVSTPEGMVLVEGGSFLMGSNEGDDDEEPVHTVNLTYDYWMGKYEVTFAEYDAFCNATGRSKPGDLGWGRGTRPVMNVSWWDAIAYCNWLSEKEGIAKAYDSNGNLLDRNGRTTTDITKVEGYRLPTEAEWEYAARGGQETNRYKYSGSNDPNEVGWYWENWGEKNRKTQPVGQKKPNVLGIYDMSGNVYEWCHDWWGDYASTTQTNPTGPSSGSIRVTRGGSWYFLAQLCRVADRYNFTPTFSFDNLGFRLSRTSF